MNEWLDYFLRNAGRPHAEAKRDVATLPPALRAALHLSLGRFYLGEAGEGRIIREVQESTDRAFDHVVAKSIVLYIHEEWRHAAEVRSILVQLGAPPPTQTWSEVVFRRARRLLGLRLKMLTIGAAEVAGVAYYSLLAERVPAASLALIARQIAVEEDEHLGFVLDLFDRAADEHPMVHTLVDRAANGVLFAGIALCGASIVAVEHQPMMVMLGESLTSFIVRCARVLFDRRAASPRRTRTSPVAPMERRRARDGAQGAHLVPAGALPPAG